MKSLSNPISKELPTAARANAIEVALGSISLSKEGPLYTSVGASVAICLFDTDSSWSGLRQVLLPEMTRGRRQDAMLQADAALEDIMAKLYSEAKINSSGIKSKRIHAKIFGGADLKAA